MIPDLFSLKGKTALVTGGNGGLGLALAKGLAEHGADIIIIGRNEKKLKAAQKQLLKTKRLVYTQCFDLHDLNAIPHFYEILVKLTGAVDILVNAAGVTERTAAEKIDMERWYEIINLNVTSVLRLSQAFAREHIRRKKPGKIINLASLLAERARETLTTYSVTKGAVLQLTRSLAVDWAPHRINVNAIGPGYFRTEMTKPLYQDPRFNQWLAAKCPQGRWGRPEELVGAAVFLASAASDFVTGQVLYVDGGWLAKI